VVDSRVVNFNFFWLKVVDSRVGIRSVNVVNSATNKDNNDFAAIVDSMDDQDIEIELLDDDVSDEEIAELEDKVVDALIKAWLHS